METFVTSFLIKNIKYFKHESKINIRRHSCLFFQSHTSPVTDRSNWMLLFVIDYHKSLSSTTSFAKEHILCLHYNFVINK